MLIWEKIKLWKNGYCVHHGIKKTTYLEKIKDPELRFLFWQKAIVRKFSQFKNGDRSIASFTPKCIKCQQEKQIKNLKKIEAMTTQASTSIAKLLAISKLLKEKLKDKE